MINVIKPIPKDIGHTTSPKGIYLCAYPNLEDVAKYMGKKYGHNLPIDRYIKLIGYIKLMGFLEP
jgi:hypothetical protein